MANFIDLVRKTRILSGMQGTGPISVENAQGVEEILVRFVRDAYIDIQNLRDNFNFLQASRSFSTTEGTGRYTKVVIFGSTTPNMKKYKKDSFIITDSNGKKSYLTYVDEDVLEARYLNDSSHGLPRVYTIDPPTRELILKQIPDGVYTVNFKYYENPEILLTDTQIPKLPLAFHNLIVYKALEKLSIYLSAPELFREYSIETARMEGQLMRGEIKQKTLRTRPFA